MVRYGPDKDQGYSYDGYREVIDQILEALIEGGKGLEVNTGGLKSGLSDLHPCTDILKRYRQLGGEIVTVGSDAHNAQSMAADFDRAGKVLLDCGFRYYTIFEKRTPEFRRI